MLRAALARMVELGRGGSIVNISSLGAFRCGPGLGPYVSSKAALLMLTRSAAVEYPKDGIRVNAVCPGSVETDMLSVLGPDGIAESTRKIPLGRLGRPADVASVALFLASKSAGFMTGDSYIVDGGRSAT